MLRQPPSLIMIALSKSSLRKPHERVVGHAVIHELPRRGTFSETRLLGRLPFVRHFRFDVTLL
jgi:hypothetical protein